MDKYTKGYLTYIEETKDIDMSVQYDFFMKYVPKGSKILDAGFGSGRDIAFFKQHYDVTGIDLSQGFVDYVKTNIHQNVHQMDILNLTFEDEFDAIWSCASQVDFNYEELLLSFENYYKALKTNGSLYVSLKLVDGNIDVRNNKISAETLIKELEHKFSLIEKLISNSKINSDVWFSVIMRSKK